MNVSEAVILEEVKKYVPPLMKWLRMHTALNSESSANRLTIVNSQSRTITSYMTLTPTG